MAQAEVHRLEEELAALTTQIGKKESEIDWQNYELAPINERKHIGGESFQDVKARAQQFLDKLKKQPQQDLLIVSHSVFILMFLSIIKGTTIEEELKTKTKNKIFIIDLNSLDLEILDIVHS